MEKKKTGGKLCAERKTLPKDEEARKSNGIQLRGDCSSPAGAEFGGGALRLEATPFLYEWWLH